MILGELEALAEGPVGTVIWALSPDGFFDVVVLDVTTRRTFEDSGTAVDFPIEDGSTGHDNFHRGPTLLAVEGEWTDTPVGAAQALEHLAQRIQELRALAGTGSIDSPKATRSIEMWNRLLRIMGREEPVFVFTDVRSVSSAAIERIVVDEDAETGDALRVAISFKEIRILATKLVPAEFDLDALIAGGGGIPDLGRQSKISSFDYTGPTIVDTVNPFG